MDRQRQHSYTLASRFSRHTGPARFENFNERLAERVRMARELHDTFLQTLQGSKLVADDALEQPSDPVHMRRAMQQLSVWLERAIHEGRAALPLRSVRSSRRPPQARPCWLAPAPMPPPAHRAGRSGRTAHRTGTSAPAWPFGPASVSVKRVYPAVRLRSPVSSGLRYAAVVP